MLEEMLSYHEAGHHDEGYACLRHVINSFPYFGIVQFMCAGLENWQVQGHYTLWGCEQLLSCSSRASNSVALTRSQVNQGLHLVDETYEQIILQELTAMQFFV
jgi:hypothetical protein